MNKEELERVGYVVRNDNDSSESFINNYIYKISGKVDLSGDGEYFHFGVELDSNRSTINGFNTNWFRLAIPQEIEMYKQAGKPVDVITYKMEKVVKMVKCISTNHRNLSSGVEFGETYKIEGDKIRFNNGEFICDYGSLVANKCFRLLQENEVKYVKSLHESQDYELNKIYKIKEIRKEAYICESANNASKLKTYFEPSTKEAFDIQNTSNIMSIKYCGVAVGKILNIGVVKPQNKIVEIPIRKKNKNKVKMEILNSPQIIEL